MERRFLIFGLLCLALLSAGCTSFYRPSAPAIEAPPTQTTSAPETLPPQTTAAPEVKETETPPPTTPTPEKEFMPHLGAEWYVAQTLKEVTRLEAVKGKVKDWDMDGKDDGFVFYLRPLAEDGTVVPVDGEVEIEVYSAAAGKAPGVLYEKNELLYSGKANIEAEKFIVYEILGEVVESQEIRVAWSGLKPYPASMDNNGFLYATLVLKDGRSFSAALGEGDPSKMVPLRGSA